MPGNSYTSAELVRRHKDGHTIFVSLSTAALYGEDGKISGIIELLEDITSRKNDEKKLKESESSYRYLFQNNPHPMMVYDRSTLAILEVNDSAVVKYGYSRDEFKSMKVTDIRPQEDVERFVSFLPIVRKRSAIPAPGSMFSGTGQSSMSKSPHTSSITKVMMR